MTNQPISAEVHEFLLNHIESIAQLEALMLLRSSEGKWDTGGVAARLYVSENEAAIVLAMLVESKLVKFDHGLFTYHPHHRRQRDIVDQVAETYSRSLVPVTKIIHEKSSGIRMFAEAFKIRKGK